MSYVFRTMIVPDAQVSVVRSLADLFGPAAQGMWTTPLSESGKFPATHWISSGYIGVEFADVLPLTTYTEEGSDTVYPDPGAFYDLCVAAGIPPESMPSEEMLNEIYHAVTVSEEEPFAATARINLHIANEETVS